MGGAAAPSVRDAIVSRSEVERGAVLVYADPDGRHYVACFGDDEPTWLRWPAEAHGWATRRTCSSTLADDCYELDARHARLALRLSGVVDDDR